jgi:Cd(II)/Pb(II)-responsive transcriptional regulator
MAALKIGELAKAAQCTVETVRYYEREGLLAKPARSGGNYRQYGPTHLDALRFIRHCRWLDMNHDEIRTLLAFREAPDENCGEVNALLDGHIGHVARHIQELKVLERELKSLRGQCQAVRPARDCGIMQSLGNTQMRSPRKADPHHKMHRTHE